MYPRLLSWAYEAPGKGYCLFTRTGNQQILKVAKNLLQSKYERNITTHKNYTLAFFAFSFPFRVRRTFCEYLSTHMINLRKHHQSSFYTWFNILLGWIKKTICVRLLGEAAVNCLLNNTSGYWNMRSTGRWCCCERWARRCVFLGAGGSGAGGGGEKRARNHFFLYPSQKV